MPMPRMRPTCKLPCGTITHHGTPWACPPQPVALPLYCTAIERYEVHDKVNCVSLWVVDKCWSDGTETTEVFDATGAAVGTVVPAGYMPIPSVDCPLQCVSWNITLQGKETLTLAQLKARIAGLGLTFPDGTAVTAAHCVNEINFDLKPKNGHYTDPFGVVFTSDDSDATIESPLGSGNVRNLDPGGSYGIAAKVGEDVTEFELEVIDTSIVVLSGSVSECA